MDRARDLVEAALELVRVDELLDEVGGLDGDDVAAEQLAVLLVADDLDHARAIAVDRGRADGAQRHLAYDDVEALLLRLGLSQPEGGDLRVAEGHGWDEAVVDRLRGEAGRVLDGDDPLVGGLVRE